MQQWTWLLLWIRYWRFMRLIPIQCALCGRLQNIPARLRHLNYPWGSRAVAVGPFECSNSQSLCWQQFKLIQYSMWWIRFFNLIWIILKRKLNILIQVSRYLEINNSNLFIKDTVTILFTNLGGGFKKLVYVSCRLLIFGSHWPSRCYTEEN